MKKKLRLSPLDIAGCHPKFDKIFILLYFQDRRRDISSRPESLCIDLITFIPVCNSIRKRFLKTVHVSCDLRLIRAISKIDLAFLTKNHEQILQLLFQKH